MNSEKIGAFIAELRREKGLTQQELAEQLGITNKAVSKWERGDGYPDITLMPLLADALSVTVDELLRGERAAGQVSSLPGETALEHTQIFHLQEKPYTQGSKSFSLQEIEENDEPQGSFFHQLFHTPGPLRTIFIAALCLIVAAIVLILVLLLVRRTNPGSGSSSAVTAGLPSVLEETTQNHASTGESTGGRDTTTTSSSATTATSTTVTTAPIGTTTAAPPPHPPIPGFSDARLNAQAALILDLSSGKTLYTYNTSRKLYPASMTKLLTAIVALEYCPDPNTILTVGEEIELVTADSTIAQLSQGDKPTLAQLTRAMLIESGCDAAYTVAAGVGRLIAGNEELQTADALKFFIDKMNETAARLGAADSRFVNPDGYFDTGHYTTAADMAKIAAAALEVPQIRDTVGRATKSDRFEPGRDHTWMNTNQLLQKSSPYYYEGCTGLKTGYNNEAGNCIAASAQRGGREILVIVMDCRTRNGSFEDARLLLDAGFQS